MDSPGRSRARRALGAMLLGLLASLVAAPSARAVPAVPPEAGTVLEGTPLAAIVGDVNGDGVRELVRLRAWADDPGRLAVEVLSAEVDGRVGSHGQSALRRTAPIGSAANALPPDADGMVPAIVGGPARLIAWREGGRERVLVATNGFGPPCCLTLWAVELDGRGATSLRLLAGTQLRAREVVAADLDGDGTDELVVAIPSAFAPSGQVLIHVLRWDGSAFRDTGEVPPLPDSIGPLTMIGDTDGLPGSEVATMTPVVGDASRALAIRLRVSPDGSLHADTASLPFPGLLVGVPGPDGPRLAVTSPDDGTALLNWPPGDEAETVAGFPRGGWPIGLLGSGDDARLVLVRADDAVDVLDANLLPTRGLTGGTAAAPFLDGPLAPYVGPLPGGLPGGAAAVIYHGRLAEAPGPGVLGGFLATRYMAALPGMTPVGVFGPGGAWMGLASAEAFPVDRRGGLLEGVSAAPLTRLSVVATDEVLTPEVDNGELAPSLDGALLTGEQPARPIVLTRGGFDVDIAAPPGSIVTFETSDPQPVNLQTVGPDGELRVSIPGPTGSENENGHGTVRLLVATPGGHGYGAVWEIHVQRKPPSLHADAATESLSLGVSVNGVTDPGATVTIDGSPVAVASDGSFATEVTAGLLPRDVSVVATDPIGNQSRTIVSVVAFYDYRTLPWVPIVVGITLVAGAVLALRAPRRRSPGEGSGSVEEIE